MKKIIITLLVLILGFTAVGYAQTSISVDVKSKEGVGKYLTDSKGMTLYYFKKDAPGKSACTGPCVEKWPVFSAAAVSVPAELKAADFGVITREDGKKQTTYKGMPLYYFVGDKKPGDTTGQGLNAIWYVVSP